MAGQSCKHAFRSRIPIAATAATAAATPSTSPSPSPPDFDGLVFFFVITEWMFLFAVRCFVESFALCPGDGAGL